MLTLVHVSILNISVLYFVESVKKDLGKPETRERIRYLNQPEWGIDKTKAPLQTEQASFRKLNIND